MNAHSHFDYYLIFYFVITVADRGVQFVSGLSDTDANVGQRAELSCKLSSDTSEGRWFKNGKLVSQLFKENYDYIIVIHYRVLPCIYYSCFSVCETLKVNFRDY